MAGRGLLRGARGGGRNVFTVRKRAPPGGDPGNVRGAGRPVPRAGTWPRRVARGAGNAGQLASQRGEAGQGPSISYMEGPCLILAGRNVFAGAATARRRPPGCATAMTRGHDREREVFGRRRIPVAGGAGVSGSARECGSAGWIVTGRGARADRGRQPCRVRMSMTGRRAVDTRAACAVSGGGHRCLVARSHPRRRVLASGVWACHEAPVR
jgi:hypothetical protein